LFAGLRGAVFLFHRARHRFLMVSLFENALDESGNDARVDMCPGLLPNPGT
jgi:hypothetical protein